MPGNVHNSKPIVTTIAPWLSVKNSAAALAFTKVHLVLPKVSGFKTLVEQLLQGFLLKVPNFG